jgi:PadR family transcriptional regulator, regulatory protein PadR
MCISIMLTPSLVYHFFPFDILWEEVFPREAIGKAVMKKDRKDLLQGTLDLLILRTLQRGKQHGWGISQIIGLRSKEALNIKEGSLYPALHRLERQGWIESDWGLSDNNRKAKYYLLTKAGRKQLEEETAYWEQFVSAVSLVLKV